MNMNGMVGQFSLGSAISDLLEESMGVGLRWKIGIAAQAGVVRYRIVCLTDDIAPGRSA